MPLCRCLPHETPVLLRFFLSGLSPPPPDAPPAPRRPSRCGSGPKKGDAAGKRHPRTCRPCKPGSVPGANPGPVIYLGRQSPAVSSNLPPGIGRATLNCRYTRSCNPRDVLPGGIAAPAVGSYPAFSPLPLRGGYFLLHLLYPHGYQAVSLRGALRCPDFPPPVARRRWSGPAGQRYE